MHSYFNTVLADIISYAKIPPRALLTALELAGKLTSIVDNTAYSTAGILQYLPVTPYHVWQHKIIHSRTITDEDVLLFGNTADSYTGIILCTYFKQPLNFLPKLHT